MCTNTCIVNKSCLSLHHKPKGYKNNAKVYEYKDKHFIVITKQKSLIMKNWLSRLYKRYEEIQGMSEDEVMKEYENDKASVLKDFEDEIDFLESKVYN